MVHCRADISTLYALSGVLHGAGHPMIQNTELGNGVQSASQQCDSSKNAASNAPWNIHTIHSIAGNPDIINIDLLHNIVAPFLLRPTNIPILVSSENMIMNQTFSPMMDFLSQQQRRAPIYRRYKVFAH